MSMTDADLLQYVNSVLTDEVLETTFVTENSDLLSAYFQEPYGDEEEGSSTVVATDVQDLVESDMPPLTKIFLGQNNVMEFKPNNKNDERDVREAKEKTAYINHIIKKAGFKVIFDFLKDADLQKVGVIKYQYEERTEKESFCYEGLTEEEMLKLKEDIETDDMVIETEYEESKNQDGDPEWEVEFTVERKKKRYVLSGVACEEFVITRNAECKDSAIVVGDRRRTTRGDLLAEGFDRDIVDQMPKLGYTHGEQLEFIRNREQTANTLYNQDGSGSAIVYGHEWSMEEVDIADLYILVDYDQDGIAERRRILKSGDYIIENEPFKSPPYALMSAIGMPHRAIGRSRAELALVPQRVKTFLWRGIMDNIASVNAGRVAVNEKLTNLDDLETIKNRGYVRTLSENPAMAVAPLNIPYVGDQALQIVQYVDFQRAASTGHYAQTQGLDVDNFYKETATRFEGVQESGDEKLELVARMFAETGFKELYEGLAWTVSHFQNEKAEIDVLGKTLTVDPRMWRYEHEADSNVGLAIEDNEQTINYMSALLNVFQQLQDKGSMLVDEVKFYNVIKRTLEAMGIYNISDYINNPEIPEDQMRPMLEQLMNQNQQMQAMMSQANPLAQVETIRQQGSAQREQIKQQADMMRFMADQRRAMEELAQKMQLEYTKIEADLYKNDHPQNVPGSRI